MLFKLTTKLTTVKFDGKGTPLYKKIDVDNISSIAGFVDFGFNNAFPNSQGFGTGLSILSTNLTGYKIYAQLHQGLKVKTTDVISFSFGYVGVAANLTTMLGYGGRFVRFAGGSANIVGGALMAHDNWWQFYKSLDDMRYAPSYIGSD